MKVEIVSKKPILGPKKPKIEPTRDKAEAMERLWANNQVFESKPKKNKKNA